MHFPIPVTVILCVLGSFARHAAAQAGRSPAELMQLAIKKRVLHVLGGPLRLHGRKLLDVAWSPDGRWVATAAADGGVALWSRTDGALHKTITRRPDAVTGLAFDPGGRLYAVSRSGTRVHGPGGDKVIGTFTHEADGSPLVAVAGDRGFFACSHPRGKLVVVHGTRDGAVRHRVPVPCERVGGIAFGPTGRYLFVVGRDPHRLVCFDVDAGQQVATRDLDKSPGPLAVNPDGRSLVVGQGHGLVRFSLPDLRQGGALRGLEESVLAAAFDASGRALYVGGVRGGLARLDGEKVRWQHQRTFQQVRALAVAPDGAMLATIGSGGEPLRFWDAKTGAAAHPGGGHEAPVTGLAWSPDGKSMVTCAPDGRLLRWDGKHPEPEGQVVQLEGGVSDVAFASRQALWAAAADGSLHQLGLDAKTGPTRLTVPEGTPPAVAGLVRPGLDLALTAHEGATLLLWHLREGRVDGRLKLGGSMGDRAVDLAISGTGDHLAVVGRDGPVEVFDVATKASRYAVKTHGATRALRVCPLDGARFAVIGEDAKDLVVIDAAARTAEHLDTGEGHPTALAATADGKRLAVAGREGVRVFETRKWKLLKATAAVDGRVERLWFDPKGRLLVAALGDCRLLVFQWQRMP